MNDPWYEFWVTQGHGYGNGTNLRPSDYSYEKMAKYIAEKIDLKQTDSLLDVGCGNGQMLEQLVPYTKFLSGVDYSKNMSVLAETLMKKKGVTGEYYKLGAENLDKFEDKTFDKVICFAVVQYFDTLQRARHAVQELMRVCKTGGVVFIGDVMDARSFKKDVGGMYSYHPEELLSGYTYEIYQSLYEPQRRFDALIKI